jgi:hypothetical protein
MQIFLSHTAADKPVVEPIAIRLAEIFGQSSVFYDAWSIQPGDGIIDKMNEGLASPDFLFFFVSSASLASKMVNIEWQNALYSSSKGKVKIVPVRVDGASMPAVLMQNVWIDLYGQGLEVALQQIVSVIQGMNTFTPQHLGFSNLTWSQSEIDANTVLIEVRASHLMEPNPMVMILTPSGQSDLNFVLADQSPHRGGFNPSVGNLTDGTPLNGIAVCPLGGAITPKLPLRIHVLKVSERPVVISGVFHQEGTNAWKPLPQVTK